MYTHGRKRGCRVSLDYTYKGLRIAYLENEQLRVGVLLDKGADIFEFTYKPRDTDFLWQSPLTMRRPFVSTSALPEGAFHDYYYGGWQEVLPSAGWASEPYQGTCQGLHGELSLLPFDAVIAEDSPERVALVRLPWGREAAGGGVRGWVVLERVPLGPMPVGREAAGQGVPWRDVPEPIPLGRLPREREAAGRGIPEPMPAGRGSPLRRRTPMWRAARAGVIRYRSARPPPAGSTVPQGPTSPGPLREFPARRLPGCPSPRARELRA